MAGCKEDDMDEKTKRIVRWALALTDMTARLGERKYISTDAKALLVTTDGLLAEMLATLGVEDLPSGAIDDDQESFDEFSARVAS